MARFLKRHESKIIPLVGLALALSLLASGIARVKKGSSFYTSDRGLTHWVALDLVVGITLLLAILAAAIIFLARRRNRT